MDALSMLYYALVCGLLAGYVPREWRLPLRFGTGAVVGIVAASVLPIIRGLF